MTYEQLYKNISSKKSYLCVGLDTDLTKIPAHLLKTQDPIFEFNKAIIDATSTFCVAYKPNTAFYEAYGVKGWISLSKTITYLNLNYPNHFTIADAKRGDIGNTATMYAQAFFEEMKFDSVTVAPYMGEDSVKPFLDFKGKWAIVLALTSNAGSKDFQELFLADYNEKLYERTLKVLQTWGTHENLMFVTGATKAQELTNIRTIAPKNFLLVPGVGAQGGNLAEVSKFGMNDHCGLLVNSSRAIIYASCNLDFAKIAGDEAQKVQNEMAMYL